MASGLFAAMGYFLLLPPVILFCLHSSNYGKRMLSTHVSIALLVLAAALCATVDTLMTLGVTATCDWIADDFNLDWGAGEDAGESAVAGGYGWKVLEITWLTTQGNFIWVETGLWLALAAALFQ